MTLRPVISMYSLSLIVRTSSADGAPARAGMAARASPRARAKGAPVLMVGGAGRGFFTGGVPCLRLAAGWQSPALARRPAASHVDPDHLVDRERRDADTEPLSRLP